MGVNIQPVRSLTPAQSGAPSCMQERTSAVYNINRAKNDSNVQALIYVNPWGANISPEGATITPALIAVAPTAVSVGETGKEVQSIGLAVPSP